MCNPSDAGGPGSCGKLEHSSLRPSEYLQIYLAHFYLQTSTMLLIYLHQFSLTWLGGYFLVILQVCSFYITFLKKHIMSP